MEKLFEKPEKPIAVLGLYIALLTALYATFSGPLRSWLFIWDFFKQFATNLSFSGRTVIVYHTLSVPFVSLIALFFVKHITLGDGRRNSIVHALFFGSIVSSLSGFIYGYLGGGMIAHGIFLFGLAIVFYGGLNLTLAVFQLDKKALKECGLDKLEQWALGLNFTAVLISAVIGASVGAFFGTALDSAFLAEDILRSSHSIFELAVISHLHIMLALIDGAVLLLIARIYRKYLGLSLNSLLKKIFYGLTIVGIIITSFATWSVMVWEGAHKIINVGAAFLLMSALILSVSAFAKLKMKIFERPYELVIFSYLILVNIFVTIPGIYVAVNLERYRTPAYLEVERSFAVGHWHILGGISALFVLMILSDFLELDDILSRISGYGAFLGSLLAFSGALLYLFREPGKTAEWTFYLIDPGLAIFILSALWLVIKSFITGIKVKLEK